MAKIRTFFACNRASYAILTLRYCTSAWRYNPAQANISRATLVTVFSGVRVKVKMIQESLYIELRIQWKVHEAELGPAEVKFELGSLKKGF